MKYVDAALVAFKKLDDNIFIVHKDRMGSFTDTYVNSTKVIDTMNTVERVAVIDMYERNLFANFAIGEILD